MKQKSIYVSKPKIANKDKLLKDLRDIINSSIYTNDGPYLKKLEGKIKKKLGLKHVVCLANGTLGLNLALKALEVTGEVVTTPFTFVASSSAIFWNSCKPVFCDVSKDTFNIDENKIESLITKETTAILATHVFGNPCNIEKIGRIAKKFKLKVIYDASHCWSVNYKKKSILSYGDISVLSFNATKIFHTIEGGACITNKKSTGNTLRSMRYFGFDQNKNLKGIGINAKMSEFHAAVGLNNILGIKKVLAKYRVLYSYYKKNLNKNKFIFFQKLLDERNYNFSYFPIIFYSALEKEKIIKMLANLNIFPREYFSPSLNQVYDNSNKCINSDYLASRIICLPLHMDVKKSDVKKICNVINSL